MSFVYSSKYNISLYGLEKIHPIDTCKYEKVYAYLKSIGVTSFYFPGEVTEKQLLRVHTQEYLNSLTHSSTIADLCEIFFIRYIPNSLIQTYILQPMRYQVQGTILAGELALKNGYCINLGGGMHHASSNDGGGWCLYSDIPLSIKNLIDQKQIEKALIIDLDVHQGNGLERDTINILPKNSTYIIDAYNHAEYPRDEKAKKAINIDIKVTTRTNDRVYISNIKRALKKSNSQFKPDIVFYNAGTDILENDPLNGGVSITQQGVIDRDFLVMNTFIKKNIPIVMVLSGGYSQESVQVICESLKNIYNKCKV
jgi:histone deacetylase 11